MPRALVLRAQIDKQRQQCFSDASNGDIETALHCYSRSIDTALSALWQSHLLENTALCLIAVGGYGREEMLPHSDVDLLILGDENALQTHGEKLSLFVTALWDLKLDIGHSVRTLPECIRLGQGDLTVATNLIEARFLCGDEALFFQLNTAVFDDSITTRSDFFNAKITEQIARHTRQGETGYKIEPNVKESPGCLRDVHTLWWVAKRHFKTSHIGDFLHLGFITDDEHQPLSQAHHFLLRVRALLHLHTGRHEDKLLLDYQHEISTQLGYRSDKPNGRVEAFMQDFFRAVHTINYFNELLLSILDEDIKAQTTHKIDDSHPCFTIIGHHLHAKTSDVFKNKDNIFGLFELLNQLPSDTRISAQTLRQLRIAVNHIDDTFRQSPTHQQQFLSFFTRGTGLTHTLRRMAKYDVLGAYLPAFKGITGLMQFDLFHYYTVEEHTLWVIRNVRRFFVERFATEHPMCNEVALSLKKPYLLYLAALFHDIAKGRGGAHEILGAEDALEFSRTHGLNEEDAQTVAWMVRAHLDMSFTAQRKDITDPDVIIEFAQNIQTVPRLKLLYLLTVADIKSTNPTLWNNFKDSLLRDLYLRTQRYLQENTLGHSDRDSKQQQTFELLGSDTGVYAERLKTYWQTIRDDYFRRFKPQEMAWHATHLLGWQSGDVKVSIRHNVARSCSEVLVITDDRPALFAGIAHILSTYQLNIVSASLHTLAGSVTLDSFFVIDHTGKPLGDTHLQQQIEQDIFNFIQSDTFQSSLPVRKRNRQLRNFEAHVDIGFEQDTQFNRTIVYLETLDHRGLLAHIAHVFATRSIQLQGAMIATSGERVHDTFFIVDKNDAPLTGSAQLTQLRDELTQAILDAL